MILVTVTEDRHTYSTAFVGERGANLMVTLLSQLHDADDDPEAPGMRITVEDVNEAAAAEEEFEPCID